MATFMTPGQKLKKNQKVGNPRYSSWLFAPSSEFADSTAFLEVTRGCSHNACRFCTNWKDVPYAKTPKEHMEYWLEYIRLQTKIKPIRRIFLQGANPFHLSYDELMEIRNLIYQYLPDLESIGCYARVSDLRDKTVEQLASLKDAGYSYIAFGTETADDTLLEAMNKGYDSKELYEAAAKLKESGLTWHGTFMLGLGGRGYGLQSAQKTAEFVNFAQPTCMTIFSLSLIYDKHTRMSAPLMNDEMEGKFIPAEEKERYEEFLAFVQGLDTQIFIQATNTTMPYGFSANLPLEKETLVKALDSVIKNGNEEAMIAFRDSVTEV